MFWKSIKKIEHDFLWKPLKTKFQNVLMSNNFVMKEYNDKYGNCILSCLETAFQSDKINIERKYLYKNFIENIKALHKIEFQNVMSGYMMTEREGFLRFWEAKNIRNQKDLARVAKKEEMFFEGNDIGTLYLLSICFKIEFVIFNESYKAIKIGDQPSIIYLYYDSKEEKYSLLGLKYYNNNNEIITIALFHKNKLPREISFLGNPEVYVLEKAKQIFLKSVENKEKFNKDKLVKKVEDNIYANLPDNHKKELGEILIKWSRELKE